MRTATLIRNLSSLDGVFGEYTSDSGFVCKTVERPWNQDASNTSCISPGPSPTSIVYQCMWQWSPKHNCNLYHVIDATRTAIEIHSANLAQQLKGCIAPGASFGFFQENSIAPGIPTQATQGVVSSVETLVKLEKDMQDKDGNQLPFLLTVKWKL